MSEKTKRTFGQNVRYYRELNGLTQKQLGDELNVTSTTIGNWELGRSYPPFNSDAVNQMNFLFGIDPGILWSGNAYKEDEFAEVPLLGRIAAGIPFEMDAVEDYIQLSRETFNRYPKSFFLRVDGESMNRILPNGSFALIDPSRKNENVVNGRIYALCVNGYDATVKVVKKLANGYALIPDSDDPTYRPQVFDYGVEGVDEITIIGEVVWYMVPPDFMSRYTYTAIDLQ